MCIRSCQRLVLAFGLVAGLAALRAHPSAATQDVSSRQVTLVGILATPGSNHIDPELASYAPELRKISKHMGGKSYGFKLLEAQSKRLSAGQTVACTKLKGFVAEAELVKPLDSEGKVRVHFTFKTEPGQTSDRKTKDLSKTFVIPPNQLTFIDRELTNDAHILIGLGAR